MAGRASGVVSVGYSSCGCFLGCPQPRLTVASLDATDVSATHSCWNARQSCRRLAQYTNEVQLSGANHFKGGSKIW